jgi:Cobalamin-independent synthase, N-terminal domain
VHWLQQKEAGIDLIPSNDFSFYDHVLDTSAMVGAVPERFGWDGSRIDLATYFAMARGQTFGHENARNAGERRTSNLQLKLLMPSNRSVSLSGPA